MVQSVVTWVGTGTFVKICISKILFWFKSTKKIVQLITAHIVRELTFQRILHMELSPDDPNKISDAMLHMFGL